MYSPIAWILVVWGDTMGKTRYHFVVALYLFLFFQPQLVIFLSLCLGLYFWIWHTVTKVIIEKPWQALQWYVSGYIYFVLLSLSWLAPPNIKIAFFRYREKCCNYWYFPSYFRPISTDNVGRQMLEKMGWSEGEGLGREGAGRREPVSIELSDEHPWIKFASINWVFLGLVFRSLSPSA